MVRIATRLGFPFLKFDSWCERWKVIDFEEETITTYEKAWSLIDQYSTPSVAIKGCSVPAIEAQPKLDALPIEAQPKLDAIDAIADEVDGSALEHTGKRPRESTAVEKVKKVPKNEVAKEVGKTLKKKLAKAKALIDKYSGATITSKSLLQEIKSEWTWAANFVTELTSPLVMRMKELDQALTRDHHTIFACGLKEFEKKHSPDVVLPLIKKLLAIEPKIDAVREEAQNLKSMERKS